MSAPIRTARGRGYHRERRGRGDREGRKDREDLEERRERREREERRGRGDREDREDRGERGGRGGRGDREDRGWRRGHTEHRGHGIRRWHTGPRGREEDIGLGRHTEHGERKQYVGPGFRRPDSLPKIISFTNLQNIATSEVNDIFTKLAQQKQNYFKELLQTTISKPDMFPLIMKIIFKVTKSHFDQQKLKLILEVCSTSFLAQLQNYLMELPFARDKSNNLHYWNNPNEFWEHFVEFCDAIVTLSPSTALQKCRSLIETTSRCSLQGLKEKHAFSSSDDFDALLQPIRERLTESENNVEEEDRRRPQRHNNLNTDEPPPECFRELSVIPGPQELLQYKPYVRPNIVKGAYQDVEHYLDVQFRLLREDCFDPLRKGINEYLNNPRQGKYENIRVFHGVRFIEPYISQDKVGLIIQISNSDIKRFRKVHWDHNKRFIYGSLLLLSNNEFKTFHAVTILDRDPKLLTEGKIPVHFVDDVPPGMIIYKQVFTMVESEVYFEPYLHVMRALQDPQLATLLPMQKYIVHANMEHNYPSYVEENPKYKVNGIKFEVMGGEWPTAEELGFNESQHRAFRTALTHELAVIQGPPGTGKTFIGVHIAKTLLKNIKTKKSLILLICYTNHALDQFLKAIMQVTKNVARVGGQSRDKDMDEFNIVKLRKEHRSPMLQQSKTELFHDIRNIRCLQNEITLIKNGILSHKSLKYLEQANVVAQQYEQHQHPLATWLFENAMDFLSKRPELLQDAIAENVNENNEENHFRRGDVILDEFESNEAIDVNPLKLDFYLNEAEKEVENLRRKLNDTNNTEIQKENITFRLNNLLSQVLYFKHMRANPPVLNVVDFNTVNCSRANLMPLKQRWGLYFRWERTYLRRLELKMEPLKQELTKTQGAYEEARMIADANILESKTVIGMTTSGAARLRKLLITLATPIVIVEEAAEVLEQHIISSLTPHCKHLILIGDHQQLRPSASSMRLAKHFHIEVSLFERLINNDVNSCRLSVQHRMRPEIAQLICPHIYPDLQNHESVQNVPNVRGINNSVFFLTHDFMESQVDTSSCNEQEADLVLGLANYIMQQDYKPEDVTILSAYAGQLFYMKKQRNRYKFLSRVKITVVDNYQGEESKIILLSLVRNNSNNKIGFLGTANRICVALSRAREGFYMFGNIDILKNNSKLWADIAGTLENNQSLGTRLFLKCEDHSQNLTEVTNVGDFSNAPEGGCLLKCEHELPCGHQCPLICHGYDRNHITTECRATCSRILCQFEHKCPLACRDDCKPCDVKVDKEFNCGHVNKIKCCDYDQPLLECSTIVTKKLPCNHEGQGPCHERPEKITCPVKCTARLPCGHVCRKSCHIQQDPDHERYVCQAECARTNAGCSMSHAALDDLGPHRCPLRCHEPCQPCPVEMKKKRSNCIHKEMKVKCHIDVNLKPCNRKCARTLPCGHFCKKKCHEPCGDCKEKVKKTIPDCGHVVNVACDKEVSRKDCLKKCNRKLPCGHDCLEACSAPCDPTKCKIILRTETFDSKCGHKVNLPCNVYNKVKNDPASLSAALLSWCAAPCAAELECSHACAGRCGACAQGRLHRACSRPCDRPNICGHFCKEPCKKICPPCPEPCEVKCPHSKCTKVCGIPCDPCNEACSLGCSHGRCSRRCREACSRAACARACPRRLRCGHACRGVCGEPCPAVCRACRPDDFPVDFLGDAYDDDDKFIQLQDCGHVMELETLNSLMLGDPENIQMRSCPFCRKPIINTYRYKDVVNMRLTTEINPIKLKVYGTKEAIRKKVLEVSQKTITVDETISSLEDNKILKLLELAFDKLKKTKKEKKQPHLLQLEMMVVYLEILHRVAECSVNFFEVPPYDSLEEVFLGLVRMILSAIGENVEKISTQMQNDIGNEIKRLNAVVQLRKIFSCPEYRSCKEKLVAVEEEATRWVLDWQRFDEPRAFEALENLQREVKVSGVVTRQERAMIVRAMGFKAGHWYKCPNGHFYCIGECGGAMQTSKCPECAEDIGGTSHRLLPSNAHASEMDGSQFPAWSETANNMANFDL